MISYKKSIEENLHKKILTLEVRTNRAYSIVLGLRERTLPPLGGVLVLRVVDLLRPAALDVELAATLDRNPTAPLCLGCE